MRTLKNISVVLATNLLLFLFISQKTYSQIYEFRNFDTRHGLYSAKVNTITEDAQGYLWVGTEGGLYRFNGTSFIKLETNKKIPTSEINCLFTEGNVVFAGTPSGLLVIEDFKLKNVILEDEDVRALFSHHDKVIAVVKDAVYSVSGKEPEMMYATFNETLRTGISYDDHIWLAAEGDGLISLINTKGEYDIKRYNEETYPGSPKNVQDMVVTEDNELWIATNGSGIMYFENNSFNQVRFEGIGRMAYSSIAYDSLTKSFWCGTWGQGVVNINPTKIHIYTEENGLPDKLIPTTYVSPSGMVYFGTITQGLSQFPGSSTIYFNEDSGLPDNNVRSIVSFNDNIYFSTYGGLSVFDKIETKPVTNLYGNKSCGPMIVIDSSKLLVGKYSGAVQMIQDGQSSDLIPADSIRAAVRALYYHDSVLYVGVNQARVYVYDDSISTIEIPGSVSDIVSLYAYDKTLVIGTDIGVYIYDIQRRKIEKFNVPEDPEDTYSLGKTKINQIGYEKRRDALLFATENAGMYLYDTAITSSGGPLVKVNRESGLYSNTIRAFIYVDDVFVLASNIAIYTVDFTEKESPITKLFDLTEFGHREINPNSLYYEDGSLWVGTGFGAVQFDYDQKTTRRHSAPRCYLSSLSSLEETYDLDSLYSLSKIEFDPSQNDFEFLLNGTNMNTDESFYVYWLEGIDNSWHKPSVEPLVTYNNLPPGKYVFHYKIVDAFGHESEEKTLAFEVNSPYWRNWEFLVIVLSIIIVFFSLTMFVFRGKNDTILEQVSIKQSLYVNRLVIFFGALSYPAISYLNVILIENVQESELPIALGLGTVILMLGLLSFRVKAIAENLGKFLVISFISIISHLLVTNYVNNLNPAHVVELIIVISFSSIIFHSYKYIILFSAIFIGVAVWIALNVVEPHYLPTQFIISCVAAVLISILLISIRLTLFSRLANSDSILHNIDSLVLVADTEGEIRFVSGSITKLLGYSREEIMGKGWWKIRGLEEKSKHLIRNKHAKPDSTQNQYVARVIHKNGSKRHFRWIETTLSNGNIAGVGHDITEVYELEKEMERLSIVAKETATGVIISNRKSQVEWANSAFLEMSGYDLKDIVGKNPSNVLVNDHLPEEDRVYTHNQAPGKESYEMEVLAYKKDGTQLWLNIIGTPILEGNEMTQIVEVVQDITEKKEKDLQLRQLSLVAQQTDNYVIITDADERVLWVNDSFTKIFEHEKEAVIDKRMREFLSLESLNPDVIEDLNKAIHEEKGNFVGELCDKTKSGNIIWVSTNVTVVLNENDEVDHIIFLGTNITDRKLKEFQIDQFARSNALLHGIDSILIKEDDNDTVIGNILDLIIEKDDNIYYSVYFEIDFENDACDMLVCHEDGKKEKWENRNIEDYSSLTTLKKGQIFIADNIMDLEELSESDKWLMLNGVRSYIMVPIIVGKQVIGTLGAGARTPHYFSDNDIDTYKGIADSMAVVYQQKEQAEKVKQSEENFRQINESISEAFWLMDIVKYELIYVNSTLLDFFELTEEEILENPKRWTKRIHPKDKSRVVKAFNNRALKDKFDEEFRILKSDFSIRWIRAKAFTIKNEKGESVRLSGSAQDITEQKKTEKAILELNDQLTFINVLTNTILNDKSIGKELLGIIQGVFNFTNILRLNIMLFDFDQKMAKYHFLLSKVEELYTEDVFPIDNVSKGNMKKLSNFEYAFVENMGAKKNLSDSDIRLFEKGVMSYLMYPLIHNNKLIGSLNISFSSSFQLEPDAVRFIKLISDGISISIYQKVLQDQIVRDKSHIESIHKDLSDSIAYAKRFQDVRLPDLSLSRKVFAGASVLYMPKDVVSGDFYWEGVQEDFLIFAAADCTGHGVPGAFMTMLFNTMLDSIIYDKGLTAPHEILYRLNEGVQEYFGSSIDSGIRDGMDIALCAYRKKDKKLFFAGARRPLLIHRKGASNIEKHDGSIMSIGEVISLKRSFKTKEITLNKGDILYLTTDGYFDQFSADNKRKFGKRRFVNLIADENGKTPSKIVNNLKKTINDWKGENYQLDDILVMVIKV